MITMLALTLAGSHLWPGLRPLSAQASAYVPNTDPAYEELDILIASGLIREVIVGQRPYSRTTFALMVREARSRMRSSGSAAISARVLEALEHLETEFEWELGRVCEGGEEECPPTPLSLTFREATADFTWADSPWRSVPTSYDIGPVPTESYIDAEMNPLLEGRQGRRMVNGWTQGLEGALEIRMGRWLTAYVQPRVWASGEKGGGREVDVGLQDGYLRAVLGNVSVEVGRNHVYLGQGRTAGAIVSHNPRGFDMVRVSNDRPFRLPWVFRRLGPASASVLAADMGSDRVIPHSKIFIGKLSIRPHPKLEMGATLLNQQFGEGAPEGSWGDRLKDLFLPGIIEQYGFSEKIAGVEARITLPSSATELYFEGATTDINFHRLGELLWDEAAWTWGLNLSELGSEGRGSLNLEAHHVGVRPYTHHDFRSGMTLDGLVLGNPLGPMGSGFSARLGWSGSVDNFALTGTWERHSGDHYEHNGLEGADFRLVRVEDNPDEIRKRIVGEWRRNGPGQRVGPQVRLGYERVTRFALTEDSRSNLLLSVWLCVRDPLGQWIGEGPGGAR